jgi:hypothetical protein
MLKLYTTDSAAVGKLADQIGGRWHLKYLVKLREMIHLGVRSPTTRSFRVYV